MSPNEARLVRNTALTVLALVALRLVAAAWHAADLRRSLLLDVVEASRRRLLRSSARRRALVIRLGTMIAGDTELGVRLVSILLALPMSYAVYRAAAILFGGVRVAATATVLLNVTLMAAVGTMIVTPDAPLLVASSFVLFCLAKVLETGRGAVVARGRRRGRRRVAVEIHRAVFRRRRSWSGWSACPSCGAGWSRPGRISAAVVACRIFSPVILWNADHQWVSFIKQIGRARIEDFRPALIGELIPTQIAFATPLVWMLGAMGLYALLRRNAGALAARMLINATFWTITLYFIWHSLHARVEANWFAPVYPAFAIAAAVAAHLTQWQPRQQRARRFLPALGRAGRHRDVCAA